MKLGGYNLSFSGDCTYMYSRAEVYVYLDLENYILWTLVLSDTLQFLKWLWLLITS